MSCGCCCHVLSLKPKKLKLKKGLLLLHKQSLL
jgi:hypothetical protein